MTDSHDSYDEPRCYAFLSELEAKYGMDESCKYYEALANMYIYLCNTYKHNAAITDFLIKKKEFFNIKLTCLQNMYDELERHNLLHLEYPKLPQKTKYANYDFDVPYVSKNENQACSEIRKEYNRIEKGAYNLLMEQKERKTEISNIKIEVQKLVQKLKLIDISHRLRYTEDLEEESTKNW